MVKLSTAAHVQNMLTECGVTRSSQNSTRCILDLLEIYLQKIFKKIHTYIGQLETPPEVLRMRMLLDFDHKLFNVQIPVEQYVVIGDIAIRQMLKEEFPTMKIENLVVSTFRRIAAWHAWWIVKKASGLMALTTKKTFDCSFVHALEQTCNPSLKTSYMSQNVNPKQKKKIPAAKAARMEKERIANENWKKKMELELIKVQKENTKLRSTLQTDKHRDPNVPGGVRKATRSLFEALGHNSRKEFDDVIGVSKKDTSTGAIRTDVKNWTAESLKEKVKSWEKKKVLVLEEKFDRYAPPEQYFKTFVRDFRREQAYLIKYNANITPVVFRWGNVQQKKWQQQQDKEENNLKRKERNHKKDLESRERSRKKQSHRRSKKSTSSKDRQPRRKQNSSRDQRPNKQEKGRKMRIQEDNKRREALRKKEQIQYEKREKDRKRQTRKKEKKRRTQRGI